MKNLALFLCLLLVCSCIDEKEPVPCEAGIDQFPIKVYVAPPQNMSSVRSTLSEDDMSRLTDLNIFVYHKGELLREHSGYYDDMSSLMLSFPEGVDDFNIYMFGNVGWQDAPSYEEGLWWERFRLNGYSDFKSVGVPVVGMFPSFKRGQKAEFALKRLVGQFNISMRTRSDDVDYLIKDVRVMNCALDVYPFREESKAAVFSGSVPYDDEAAADVLTAEDINALNDGQTVSLYFIENVQGELLPGNTDPKLKIPSSLPEDVAHCCTYIEITADVSTPCAKYTDCRYRFYPGENTTTDFSIRRNTLYEILLDFTQNMVNEEEWRIEADYPEIVGVKIDKEVAQVVVGAEDMIYVQAFDKDGNLLDFDVDLPGCEVVRPDAATVRCANVSVSKEIVDYRGSASLGKALGLRFTSCRDLQGLYEYGSDPDYYTTTVRITGKETFNGEPLYSKDLTVKTYYKLFPLLLNLENADSQGYKVVMRGMDPMGLRLAVQTDYNYGSTARTAGEWSGSEMRAQEVGSLAAGVSPGNLSTIDFIVRGVAEPRSADGTLVFPRMRTSENLYMGPDEIVKATWGSGSLRYPAKFPNMADNGKYEMLYYLSENSYVSIDYYYDKEDKSGLGLGGVGNGNLPVFGSRPYGWSDAACGQALFADWRLTDRWNEFYFYSIHTGVSSKQGREYDYSTFTTPFYFMNGGLTSNVPYAKYNLEIVRYPNRCRRGFQWTFYGPGRDLFPGNRNGSLVNVNHKAEYWMETWKPLIGKTIKTEQVSKGYTGQLYMTINGASCWAGCNTSEFGCYIDDL